MLDLSAGGISLICHRRYRDGREKDEKGRWPRVQVSFATSAKDSGRLAADEAAG